MMKKWILNGLAVMSLSLLANIVLAATTTPAFTDPTKPIMLKQAQPDFDVNLASNPTTGYSWFIKSYPEQQLQLVSHQYNAPNTKLVGAGGYENWHFRAQANSFLAPQIFTITFLYIRPWEVPMDGKPIVITVVTT